MKRTLLLCLPLFVLASGFLSAQGGRLLTLEEACALAEQNSISLQKQGVDLEFDRTRAKNLWAQVFPAISASGGVNYNFPLNSDAPKSPNVSTEPAFTATVRLSLGLSAGLPLTMANISLAYKNSLLNYEQARRILINQTSKTFYSLLAQKNNLTVLEGTMRLAGEQLERDRIARRSGYVGELDFLSAQVSAERAKLAYNRALADYQNSLGKFLSALGLDQRETITPEGNPEITGLSLDPETLINERLALRPDITAQHNEIERLKNARTESLLSNKAPSVNFSASWGASAKNGLDDTVSAGVTVTIPIDPWIPGTRSDQTVKRSDSDYKKAVLELQNMENTARQEIRSLTDSVRITWTEVQIARLQAGYAQRAYELAEQSYRRGTMNFLDFEAIRNRLTDARQQQLQSELNYKVLVLDLASSLNMEERELQKYSR
jgi:outer membrane protein TolC